VFRQGVLRSAAPDGADLHGVISVHHTVVLQGEDALQILARLRCGHRERSVEFRKVFWPRKRLASSMVVMPRSRNSCGSRLCQMPKFRSLRPRACGE